MHFFNYKGKKAKQNFSELFLMRPSVGEKTALHQLCTFNINRGGLARQAHWHTAMEIFILELGQFKPVGHQYWAPQSMWFGTNFPSHSANWIVMLDARCLVTPSVPSLPFLQGSGCRGDFPPAGTVLSHQTTAPCPAKSRHGVPAELFLPQKEPKMRRGKMD